MQSPPSHPRSAGVWDAPDRKRRLNEEIFTRIAGHYDRINRLLSFGRDAVWKQEMVALLPKENVTACLDVACGTGDLAALLRARYPNARITGVDLTESMLAIARNKHAGRQIEFVQGDMGRLAAADESVDILTGGYALRNAPNLPAFLREVHRVLRPDGRAVFLEFSRSDFRPRAALDRLLLQLWGGFWGLIFHRDPRPYLYLAESLRRFPTRSQLRQDFARAGLQIQSGIPRSLGLIEICLAQKIVPSRYNLRADQPARFAAP